MTDPDTYDHYRVPPEGPIPAGVYRVVGTEASTVVLVRLTDRSGRRTHTGQIERIDSAALDELAPAADPDDGFSLRDPIDQLSAIATMVRYRLF